MLKKGNNFFCRNFTEMVRKCQTVSRFCEKVREKFGKMPEISGNCKNFHLTKMATTLSDIIVPEVFAASIIEETTLRDSFLQSGVVAPLAELNLSSTQGGNFVNIPFYKANLSGNYTRLDDSSSLTPNKIEQSSQIGVVLTAGDAFSARQLAGQKIGSNSPDPISAIRQKLGAYINNEKQKERTKALVDAGSVPRGDLLDIDATVASSQQAVIVAENTLLISKLSLAQLLQMMMYY